MIINYDIIIIIEQQWGDIFNLYIFEYMDYNFNFMVIDSLLSL